MTDALLTPNGARALNALGLAGCSAILLVAFGYQVVDGELPCPLCILQRAAFAAAGMGFALNVCLGARPGHYAIVVLGSVAGFGIAARQTLLHIVPGTGVYGSALFGLHFYVWSLIAFAGLIVAAAILCLFEGQFVARVRPSSRARIGGFGLASVLLFLAITLANAGSTLAECGGGLCPDNPTRYEFWDSLLGR
ncbi:disulfide bond formation protein B [Methylobacterium sp. 37f]|uniref:disulfide bond formation protein B n=1 Tax=Methylobacterium sp. 37f TaxID=2817058 RepID=UPI001FFD240D|nr:disulfide bond formation protein B [Methylobacterium sp. 37f]